MKGFVGLQLGKIKISRTKSAVSFRLLWVSSYYACEMFILDYSKFGVMMGKVRLLI